MKTILLALAIVMSCASVSEAGLFSRLFGRRSYGCSSCSKSVSAKPQYKCDGNKCVRVK